MITNRNKAVFTVRPFWVTNGRRSAVVAMLGSSLRMPQFRLGMDGPCRSTKQGGLSDFVSHTWQFLVSFLVHIIRDQPGKATDVIAGICTFPRLPCPSTKRHVMLNLTSTGVCNTGTSALYVCYLLL